MKVKATKRGYYGDKIREEGEVFEIKGKEEFSENWMEAIEKNEKPAKKEG